MHLSSTTLHPGVKPLEQFRRHTSFELVEAYFSRVVQIHIGKSSVANLGVLSVSPISGALGSIGEDWGTLGNTREHTET